MEFDLGEGMWLSASTFNGKHMVHVRKYICNYRNGLKYPTKKGITMSPNRFASLVVNLQEIDDAYDFVSKMKGEYRTIHIGGTLFATVNSGFAYINLRHFYKAPDGTVLPSQYGIPLSIPVWRALTVFSVILKEDDPELRSVETCNAKGGHHYDQMGFFQCEECYPFSNITGPCADVLLPTAYNPMLRMVLTPVQPHHSQSSPLSNASTSLCGCLSPVSETVSTRNKLPERMTEKMQNDTSFKIPPTAQTKTTKKRRLPPTEPQTTSLLNVSTSPSGCLSVVVDTSTSHNKLPKRVITKVHDDTSIKKKKRRRVSPVPASCSTNSK